jgi:ribosomal protein L37AE/L43A
MDICKKCRVKTNVHYAAGFDIWTCPVCGISADSRAFFDHFEEIDINFQHTCGNPNCNKKFVSKYVKDEYCCFDCQKQMPTDYTFRCLYERVLQGRF